MKCSIILILLLCAGCSANPLPQPVGGSCDYDSSIGIATIISYDGDTPLASFTTRPSGKSIPGDFVYPVRLNFKTKVGAQYPAIFEQITSGSCTPYSLNIISAKNNDAGSGIFLEFDKEGNLATESAQKIAEISQVAKVLESKALKLELCGQTDHKGVADYNFSIGEKYAQQVRMILQQREVSATQFHTLSRGELGCSPSCSWLWDGTSGVCVSFSGLTPQ
jgi:hypothetical protein